MHPVVSSERLLRSVVIGDLRSGAIAALRDAILGGVLKPGDRLNEQALCAQLEMSRPPLREAIRSLEHEGLVRSIPRRGSFVRTLTGDDVEEIYAVRCALEGMAAELVIERATERQIDELEQLVLQVETTPPELLHETIATDLRFHRRLVALASNSTLARMWNELASQLHLALTLVNASFYAVDYVEATHRSLVAAIRRGDVDEAWRLIRSLREVGHNLKERWDEMAATAFPAPTDEPGKTDG